MFLELLTSHAHAQSSCVYNTVIYNEYKLINLRSLFFPNYNYIATIKKIELLQYYSNGKMIDYKMSRMNQSGEFNKASSESPVSECHLDTVYTLLINNEWGRGCAIVITGGCFPLINYHI